MRRSFSTAVATLGVSALLLTGAAPADAAPNPAGTPGHPIVGGHDATQLYPAMASLQLDRGTDAFGHTCGATLLTYRGVTGAHGVTADDASALPTSLFKLRVGSALHASGGTLLTVRAIVPHPEWDWATGDDRVADIALLLLPTGTHQPGITITAPTTDTNVRPLGWVSTKQSMRNIATDIGVCVNTVHRLLILSGLKKNPRDATPGVPRTPRRTPQEQR